MKITKLQLLVLLLIARPACAEFFQVTDYPDTRVVPLGYDTALSGINDKGEAVDRGDIIGEFPSSLAADYTARGVL